MPEASPKKTQSDDLYRERLWLPIWWWLGAAVVVGVVGYELQLVGNHRSWTFVWYPILAVAAASVLWSMSGRWVRVDANRELWAGRAHLPVAVMARAATVPASAKSAALGRQLDPAAFLAHHAWVKTMVLVVLDDPTDPTPYWLVSTRHPGAVIAALGLSDALTES